MSLMALWLYGSVSRGDNSKTSDLDLLGVYDDNKVQLNQIDIFNFIVYPYEKLNSMAVEGDLFILHLITEGCAIYDPNNILEEIRNSFEFKTNYLGEISTSIALGFNLIDLYNQNYNNNALVKGLYYSLRTIIISENAKSNNFTFNLKYLLSLTSLNDEDRKTLIEFKNFELIKHDCIQIFKTFFESKDKEYQDNKVEIGSKLQSILEQKIDKVIKSDESDFYSKLV